VTSPPDPFAAPDPNAPAPAPATPAQDPAPLPPAPYGQAYGQATAPYGSAPPAAGARNGLGTAALVLGILAVITFWTVVGAILLGIAAIVTGALGRGRAQRREATNGGVALAGLILGVVSIVLLAGVIALGLSFLNSDSGKNLRSCLNDAGSSQEAQQACADKFQNDFNN
jgi:hypothetical protein